MTYSPDSVEGLYLDLRENISGKVEKITNFTERSFNRVFLSAIANYFREVELRLLASELSGYIEYAGGPITEDDLNRLGVEDVEPEELEPYLYDEQLERLVDILGISRNEGDKATGFIDVNTDSTSAISIPAGTTVSTTPDESGETKSFVTVEEENSPEGSEIIFDIEVESVERGSEYNIPANSITRFESPPIGVKGVLDSTGMSGGEDIESNDSLRQRARNSLSEQPTGGTANGIVGYISDQIENVDPENVTITELYEENLVEVTVDGGGDNEVETAIEEGRPVGVRHDLIRPQNIEISVKGKLLGENINITFTSNRVENYLLNQLNVSNNLYRDKIIRNIVNSSESILNVSQLTLTVSGVTNERITYTDGKDKYRLDYTYNGGTSTIFDEYGNTYSIDDGDYEIIDNTGDTTEGIKDTVNWLTGPTGDLETGDDFFVNYSSSQETDFIPDEKHTFNGTKSDAIQMQSEDQYKLSSVPDESTLVVESNDGSVTYDKGSTEDYTLVNSERKSKETEFVFTSGQSKYELNESIFESSIIVEDSDGNQYTKGTDYELIDDDGDGIVETVNWLTDSNSSSTPSNDVTWTAEYSTNNGIKQTIDWNDDSDKEPAVGDTFVAKYQKSVYTLENEVNIINDEKITCSCAGSTYDYEIDFEFVDYNANGRKDSIRWLSGQSRPSDGTPFYVTYKSNGDIDVNKQQKIDAGNIRLTEV